MPVDVVKLLKTQDAGYVRTLVSTEEKVGLYWTGFDQNP